MQTVFCVFLLQPDDEDSKSLQRIFILRADAEKYITTVGMDLD